MHDIAVLLRRFENPDEVRTFEKGRLELITIAGTKLGRASYEPGWKWSVHVGPTVGAARCTVEHLGLVLSGHAPRDDDGRVWSRRNVPFPAEPHDSWVIGVEPSRFLLGAVTTHDEGRRAATRLPHPDHRSWHSEGGGLAQITEHTGHSTARRFGTACGGAFCGFGRAHRGVGDAFAYVRSDVLDRASRPVMFAFNGGPAPHPRPSPSRGLRSRRRTSDDSNGR
jgi:hypothetical protein